MQFIAEKNALIARRNGEVVTGGKTIRVAAPIDEIPVFRKR